MTVQDICDITATDDDALQTSTESACDVAVTHYLTPSITHIVSSRCHNQNHYSCRSSTEEWLGD